MQDRVGQRGGQSQDAPAVNENALAPGKELPESILTELRECARFCSNTLSLGVELEHLTGLPASRWPEEWHETLRRIVLEELKERDPSGEIYCGAGGWAKLEDAVPYVRHPQEVLEALEPDLREIASHHQAETEQIGISC